MGDLCNGPMLSETQTSHTTCELDLEPQPGIGSIESLLFIVDGLKERGEIPLSVSFIGLCSHAQ